MFKKTDNKKTVFFRYLLFIFVFFILFIDFFGDFVELVRKKDGKDSDG